MKTNRFKAGDVVYTFDYKGNQVKTAVLNCLGIRGDGEPVYHLQDIVQDGKNSFKGAAEIERIGFDLLYPCPECELVGGVGEEINNLYQTKTIF